MWLLAIFAANTIVSGEAIILALGYTVLLAAFVPKGKVLQYNRLGDYSYGTYIYAFPSQQLMVHPLPDQDWITNVAISLPVTLVPAILSWTLIEQPALGCAGSIADRLVKSPRIALNPSN